MIFRKYFAQLILLPVLASPLAALAGSSYYKVAIAPAGFDASRINNRGQIVGTSGGHPAIWYRSSVTEIAGLTGQGMGINNHGDIVGIAPLPSNEFFYAGFVYTRAGVRYISVEEPWNEYAVANAINDAGQVAGMGHAPVGESARGFLNSRRGTRLIGTFGGEWSNALSINSAGHVVGMAALSDTSIGNPHMHAFVYRSGVLKDLGTFGGRNSLAWDINDAGQVVGYADTPAPPDAEEYETGPTRAFLYERGTMKDLGTLGGWESTASAINNAGVVVGSSTTAETGSAAFVYARGKMTDLNTRVRLPEGWTLVSGQDINDSGQILARACNLEDCGFWARLTPRHDGKELDDADDADGKQ
jgi:probable HAF family extracellular repeat protein